MWFEMLRISYESKALNAQVLHGTHTDRKLLNVGRQMMLFFGDVVSKENVMAVEGNLFGVLVKEE